MNNVSISRRKFFFQSAGGFLGLALGDLLARANEPRGGARQTDFPPRAKSVIFLFMCGGVSHIDTFDPKGNRYAGTLIDAIGFGDNSAPMRRPVIPCLRTFRPYGQSGTQVSDWFPHIGGVVDEIAMVRSMWCNEANHFPAAIECSTGHRGRVFDHPTLGSWVTYALGTLNENLPAFVNIGRASSPVQLTGGYLGAVHAATPFQPGPEPVPNLHPHPFGWRFAAGEGERTRQMQALHDLNQEFRQRHALNSEIAARASSYELAARMQVSAPEAVDFSHEPRHVKELYGIDTPETDDFGRQLLLARRLAERGVRFIQVCHGGGGNGRWDAHGDILTQGPLCLATDKPIAGLIRDLKQRGMLDETLVVWTSEFGRSPWSQNTTGRDHNPRGFTSWLAGGGVQGGTVHGATDDFGFRAVVKPHYFSDLHATILHQLGLSPERMEVHVLGRTMKLIEEGHGPIREILS